jgi:hypothetical protein
MTQPRQIYASAASRRSGRRWTTRRRRDPWLLVTLAGTVGAVAVLVGELLRGLA